MIVALQFYTFVVPVLLGIWAATRQRWWLWLPLVILFYGIAPLALSVVLEIAGLVPGSVYWEDLVRILVIWDYWMIWILLVLGGALAALLWRRYR